MFKDIFISYNSDDADVANQLVSFIESNSIGCFIAPRDIDPGKAYAANLMQAIDNCKLVILVATEKINDSEHVLNEVDVIIEKKKPILPIFVEDFVLNDDYRYYLGRKQWIVANDGSLRDHFNDILSAVEGYLPKLPKPEPKIETVESTRTKTVFEYVPERGIMINPEDHQRNVSFRTDTLINLMGGIYDDVLELVDEEKAENIFYTSGYKSGANFADRINSQWDTGYSINSIIEKLHKWCEFDSEVGWGKFSIDVAYNESTNSIEGTLKINECFIVDKAKKRKICGFIKGYCSGVLEGLLGSVEIELSCAECPLKNRFMSQCVFNFIARG